MIRQYLGTVWAEVQCPECGNFIYMPEASTDLQNIWVECPYCLREFILKREYVSEYLQKVNNGSLVR